jgi:hypothetical protein
MPCLRRVRELLSRPIDGASLAVWRALFGCILLLALVRTWAKGLVYQHYIEPKVYLPFYGFDWLPRPSPFAAYALFGLLVLLAFGICLGLFTRLCAGLFCLLFSYLHLLDATYYLNHYYLVSLLSGLLACSPAGQVFSLDARRARRTVPAARGGLPSARPAIRRFWLAVFRVQVGLVYFFAGLAKVKADWLFAGQPLRTWLAANTDVPLLGQWFSLPWTPLAMSWLGAFFDLTIALWLSWRRTRLWAFAVVVLFHAVTARMFEIGIFPYLMIANASLFFPPDWPRRWLGAAPALPERLAPVPRASLGLAGLYLLIQILVPLRHFLYPGDMLWTEQGYRFAWHVMVIEKTGSIRFQLVERQSGARRTVFPGSYLTPSQVKAMATQPDLILAFAHILAREERQAGRDVAVYADGYAVLNGRPAARLVDPRVDLTQVRDGFRDKPWITHTPPAARR